MALENARSHVLESQMRSENTPITVGVSEHVLVGSLRLAGARIQEQLNDSNWDIVKLFDVEVHSHLKRECLAHLPEVVVPKSKIEYLLVSASQHEAPEKRWNNHRRKRCFTSFAILSECCISGELYLTSEFADAHYALAHQLPGFFAITKASVRVLGGEPLHVPLVFANKDYVSCLHIGDLANVPNSDVDLRDVIVTASW